MQEAADYCVKESLDEGFAELISMSLSKTDEVTYDFNYISTFMGCAIEDTSWRSTSGHPGSEWNGTEIGGRAGAWPSL
jgi:hypothetical protein